MAIWWLLASVAAVYMLYKLLVFVKGDCDLTVLSKRLRPQYYKDRVVWVTGASSGIGESLCHQLSRHGAKLILSARSVEKLERVREALASPENARVLPVDLSDADSVRSVAEKARELFGRVDILINNAGIWTRTNFVDCNEDVTRKVMEVDFFGPWTLTHTVLPGMMAEGYGHIVNICSFGGKMGMNMRSAYSAAKFAMVGLMEAIRLEVIGKNIYVTNICPGPVKTQLDVNGLTGDGETLGRREFHIQKSSISADRCAEVILIGVSNQLHEVWIAKQPILMAFYCNQYMPTVLRHMMNSPKLAAEFAGAILDD